MARSYGWPNGKAPAAVIGGHGFGTGRPAFSRVVLALLALCSGCAGQPGPDFTQPGKLAGVVVGRSSRAEVFAALGRPARTERSSAGEAWVFEASNQSGPSAGLVSGATVASSVVGAFVPFAGLVGTGIGLANSSRPAADTVTLVVKFDPNGVVQDCTQTSTAAPVGLPGVEGSPPPDCTRPAPGR